MTISKVKNDINFFLQSSTTPTNVYINIFKFLPPHDLTFNCKVVCKKWNAILNSPFFASARLYSIYTKLALHMIESEQEQGDAEESQEFSYKKFKELCKILSLVSPEKAKELIEYYHEEFEPWDVLKLLFSVEKIERNGSYIDSKMKAEDIFCNYKLTKEQLYEYALVSTKIILQENLENKQFDDFKVIATLNQSKGLCLDKILYNSAISTSEYNIEKAHEILELILVSDWYYACKVKINGKIDLVQAKIDAQKIVDFDLKFDAYLFIAEQEKNLIPLFDLLKNSEIYQKDPYYLQIISAQAAIDPKQAQQTLNCLENHEMKLFGQILLIKQGGDEDYSSAITEIKEWYNSKQKDPNKVDAGAFLL